MLIYGYLIIQAHNCCGRTKSFKNSPEFEQQERFLTSNIFDILY